MDDHFSEKSHIERECREFLLKHPDNHGTGTIITSDRAAYIASAMTRNKLGAQYKITGDKK